ncbi:SDR family NAD(P)-dependent oxidoreductase [Pseudomonas putida]|uniref:SDR family NAD(P)-dependent oxidoreductase n=1 Tax=Pseudomonas putida TaxID=303 RepID=UPI0022722A4E|nr:SDR family NAD(P)-dependent oxidoreductase [Pseudomonas putida]WAB99265.1 SDR family NAD(P)-dependent oxidoreductase [Pseudomonas putida]
MKLEGKIAFVTGAASGIGAATVDVFVAQGATVIAADLSLVRLNERFQDPRIQCVELDVSDSKRVNAVFSELNETHGKLDVLINAAGINAPSKEANDKLNKSNIEAVEAAARGERFLPTFLDDTSDEEFAKVLAVNLAGTFYCLRAAAPLMKKAGGGSVVNISSVAALVGVPMPLYYPASKAAVLGLTRSAAGELAPHNIRVNAVAPGAVDTPLLNTLRPDIKEKIVAMQPIPRAALPAEIAQTLLFLACDDGAYYTGQTLCPSGGIYM